MQVSELLDRKLDAVQETTQYVDFFKHVHNYIKFILETPELKTALDVEEADFYKKLQFTEDNLKLENLNFYQAYFVLSYVRIYLPIEHYQNTYEPDEEQDPVALLLLYGPKHPRTQSWVRRYPSFRMRWDRKRRLKSYWSWFDGKREEYVNEIKNLHLKIITELSKDTQATDLKVELPLHLNLETGDFHYGNVTSSLNIKSQPFRVLSKLVMANGNIVPYLELIQCLKPNAQQVTKTDKQKLSTVIRNLKKDLGILSTNFSNKDIFHNEKQVGYSLKSMD